MITATIRKTIAMIGIPLAIWFSMPVTAQTPIVEWQACLGGTDLDVGVSVVKTIDGGYVTAGTTVSNDSMVSGNHGNSDCWVVKQDSDGNVMWQVCLGGSDLENGYALKQTADGGFILAGTTQSTDGDVTGNNGSLDAWIVKLDSAGSLVWQKTVGGTGFDLAYDIIEADNGDLVFCGGSSSGNGDLPGNQGGIDFIVARLTSAGGIIWVKNFGGTDDEVAYSVIQTAGGGLLIGGYTESNDGDVSGNHGGRDFWIVKLNSNDNFSWQQCQGGSADEEAHAVLQASSGKFYAAGYAASSNGDVGSNQGGKDYWITCFGAPGTIIWEQNYGGSNDEEASALRELLEGGFILAGYSSSNNGQVNGNHGLSDIWLMKIDDLGKVIWNKCYGGTSAEHGSFPKVIDIQQCPDKSFMLAGLTGSNNGNVSGHIGNFDVWTAKLTIDCIARPTNLEAKFITATSAKLTWDKIALAKNYNIRYRETGTSVWISKFTSGNVGKKELSGLDTATTYEWKVRTRCQSNPSVWSKWSQKDQFTTASMRLVSGAVSPGKVPEGLFLFPNPAGEVVYISMEGPEVGDEEMTLEIISITGQSVYTKHINAHSLVDGLATDVSFLEKGIYVVRASAPGRSLSKRLLRN